MNTPDDDKRQKRIVIALVILFASVMAALGLWSIAEGYYFGQTKKGTAVVLDGNPARWMGLAQICIGMFIAVLAMPNLAAAKKWMTFWVALLVICLAMVLIK